MRIDELTSREFAEEMARDPVVILPLGATEAHGVHLPLCTDSLQPMAVADMLAERVDALVAPLVPYGMHSSTLNMPGTIGISFDTLRALVTDLLSSLVDNGATRVVVIAGHAGSSHMTAIKLACQEAVRRMDVRIMFMSDYELVGPVAKEHDVDPYDGHAGTMETSRVMAIRPDLVKDHRPEGAYVSHGHQVLRNPERCFPRCVAGRPQDSTREMGEEANRCAVNALVGMIERDWGL